MSEAVFWTQQARLDEKEEYGLLAASSGQYVIGLAKY